MTLTRMPIVCVVHPLPPSPGGLIDLVRVCEVVARQQQLEGDEGRVVCMHSRTPDGQSALAVMSQRRAYIIEIFSSYV